MRQKTGIAHLVAATTLTACMSGAVLARDSVSALRNDLVAVQSIVTANTEAIQILNLNQDRNIVLSAGYTGAAGFDEYYIHLLRVSQGCRVFVGDTQVSATTSVNSQSILLDPDDIMAAGEVPQFINKAVSIPMQVGCFPSGDDGMVEKGHVTGTLYPQQAPLPHDHD